MVLRKCHFFIGTIEPDSAGVGRVLNWGGESRVLLGWGEYKINILFQGKERSAKTKLMPAKLCAVLVCAESIISQLSMQKRIFQLNHFSLFIRGPVGLDSWKKGRKIS